MIASELISNFIKPLSYKDSGEFALLRMHEYNLSQLPVLNGEEYAGIVSLEEITFLPHLDKALSDLLPELRKPSVLENAHLYDVMRAALDFEVKIIPVTNRENKYLGLITAESCLRSFAQVNSLQHEGGIIELSIPIKDYHLSELIRVTEENNLRVMNFYSHLNDSSDAMEITLKINGNELGSLLSAYERYGFQVTNIFHEAEYSEDLKEHYDALLKYLNV